MAFRHQKPNGEVVFDLGGVTCWCGSGNPLSACHPTISARPAVRPVPKTGLAREGCYCNVLSDCSEKLTGEHWVSEQLLAYLNRTRSLTVSGLPWLREGPRTLAPSALGAKVLCDRHNGALGVLDEKSRGYFDAFDCNELPTAHRLIVMNGHDFERWLLKILCGAIASKSVTSGSDAPEPAIQASWPAILFGEQDFAGGQGLYVCRTVGHTTSAPQGLLIRFIADRGGNISGIGLIMGACELVLSMSGFPSREFDGRQFVYRPCEIHSRIDGKFERSVWFHWDTTHADLGTISMESTRVFFPPGR